MKDKCHFYKEPGYYQKDCLKRKSQFEKKDNDRIFVYFESNLTKVIFNRQWIDFETTTYVSNTMHGFITIQNMNPSKNFVLMENRLKAPIEGIRTYLLILDIGHHFDLLITLYILTITCNLI